MKKVNLLYLIAFFGVFFTACHSDDDTRGDWAKSNAFPGDYRVNAVAFQDGDVVFVGMGYNRKLSTNDKYLRSFYSFDGNNWTREADFPAEGRKGCVAFVIGDTAYVGGGFRGKQYQNESKDIYYSDFYKFDLKKKEWCKNGNTYLKTDIKDYVADSIACRFWGGVAFEMNGKGYAGTGMIDNRPSKDMFIYNPADGSWTASTIGEGDPRVGAVVFKLEGKVVLCLGSDGSRNNTDVMVFDGSNWTKKRPLKDQEGSWNDDYDKIPRSYGVAFTSNRDEGPRGYVAGGVGVNTVFAYRIDEDIWYEVTEFSAAMSARIAAVGFSIDNYGYVTTGGSSLDEANDNSTWKFIPGIDEDDKNDY